MQSDQQFFQIVQAGSIATVISTLFGAIIMVFVGKIFSFLRDILAELQRLNGHGVSGSGGSARKVASMNADGFNEQEQLL